MAIKKSELYSSLWKSCDVLKKQLEIPKYSRMVTMQEIAELFEFEIFIANSLEEQTAIANMLSDMDAEIKKTEIKLNKYKNIKKGMMEELLTGKRRLI